MATGTASARSRSQRKLDTLEKLRTDVDLWVASASEDGQPYLIPLSYYWDGSALTVGTSRESPTARNLIRAGWARVGLRPTRDVVMIEGDVEAIRLGTRPELEEQHARAAGFDPRELSEEYVYLRITPQESRRGGRTASLKTATSCGAANGSTSPVSPLRAVHVEDGFAHCQAVGFFRTQVD